MTGHAEAPPTQGQPTRSILTIAGDLGSGKSTVAKLVAEKLGLKLYSTGAMQRELAAKLGVTSLQLNQMAESDRSIDDQIDSRTVELARTEDNLLFDSRLAWRLVPDSFKVFLSVDPRIGTERIYGARRGPVEQYASLEEAMMDIQARRASENKRYAELYGVDPEELSNYDLVIDTTHVAPDRVAVLACWGWQTWLSKEYFPEVWLGSKTPFPLQDVVGLDVKGAERAMRASAGGTNPSAKAMGVIRAGRYYYAYEGHAVISAYIRNSAPVIPGTLRFNAGDMMDTGETAGEFAERECTLKRVRDWEEAHGFKYPSYPAHLAGNA